MRRFTLLVVLALLCCAMVGAWQSAINSLGLTQQQLQESMLNLELPYLSGAGRMAAKAMTPEQRAAAVREVGGAVKTLANSAAFQKVYDEYIQKQYHAVNHGIKLAAPGAQVNDVDRRIALAKQQSAVQMAMMMRIFPIDAAKAAFAEKQQSWADILKDKDSDPEEKALARKMQERAKSVAPLAQSNPDAFIKGLSLLTSIEMGGPETEEALVAASEGSEKQEQMESEQRAWDQHNLKANLRTKLAEFIKTADSVDFTAQTRDERGRKVFVNPAYERNVQGGWKEMYRAGKAPTAAASELAKAWLQELR